MTVPIETQIERPPVADRLRSWCSRAAATLALAVLAGTFLLISPPGDQTYPGQVPWRDGSWLHAIVHTMSLAGVVSTARGVEIKELTLHAGVVVGLMLLAGRALLSGFAPARRRTFKGAWFLGQVFIALWALFSLSSAAWSGDARLSFGQGAAYALVVAWALVLAWTLDSRDLPWLLAGYVAIAAAGATLTIWYYYERNPHHRPGFPIGNPGPLAACILPAIVLTACGLWQALTHAGRVGRDSGWVAVALRGLALIPLLWCFWLTGSRGGVAAAAVAGLTILFLQLGRRARWAVALCGASVLLAALIWYGQSAQDVAMARGATIRFRLYSWRYAAQLWSMRSISGHGAGAYPRYADQLSVGDQVLDPGAFMGENIGHAHNELFEVFTELGLVLGVSFVAGHVATIVAGFALMRASLSPQRRWMLAALVASVAALLADSMFGVGLRLPGLPAVFYTLLGALWAACRSHSRQAGREIETPTQRGSAATRRYSVAIAAAVGAALALNITARNWIGALAEQQALAARGRDNERALDQAQLAQTLLLDPLRALASHDLCVDLELRLARSARDAWAARRPAPDAPPAASLPVSRDPDWTRAVARGQSAIAAADALRARAPAFGRAMLHRARVAELLVELYGDVDPQAARLWFAEAWSSWRARYEQRPYERETLLALCRYPDAPVQRVEWLRNALRTPSAAGDWFPAGEWHELLRGFAQSADFEPALAGLVVNAGPFDPRTDLDILILSFAPETYRLRAAWNRLRQRFGAAAAAAERAVELYAAMRMRFPELYCVALAEQADYALRARPREPAAARDLAQRALDALPRIQSQKYASLAAPFRTLLARCELAAGDESAAARQVALLAESVGQTPSQVNVSGMLGTLYVQLVQDFARRDIEERPDVGAWVEAALRLRPTMAEAWAWKAWLATVAGTAGEVERVLEAAEAAGLTREQIGRIRRGLDQEFPASSSAPSDAGD